MSVVVIGSREARAEWRSVLDSVLAGNDVLIERSGRKVAALLPYDDYEKIRELIEDLRADRRAAEAYASWQRDRSGAIPWEEYEADLVAGGLLGDEPLPNPD